MSKPAERRKRSWYVVHTKPKQEYRAYQELSNQAYCCFLPTLQTERVRRGKVESVNEPFFARYLFIALDIETDNWSSVRSTRGVHHLVAFGGRLASVPDECIEALRATSLVNRSTYESGDRVTILGGPLAGLEGIYQCASGEARAHILIELLGRQHELSLADRAFAKVAS